MLSPLNELAFPKSPRHVPKESSLGFLSEGTLEWQCFWGGVSDPQTGQRTLYKMSYKQATKTTTRNSSQDLTRAVLRHRDVEGAARDVLLSPLHGQDIIPLLLDDIRDVVLLVAHMLHGDLFAGSGGPMDPNQQHVGTWEAEEGGYSVRMHPRRQRKRDLGAEGMIPVLPVELV